MSLNRRRIRELAMQILFLWDNAGESDSSLAGQLAADVSELDDAARHEALRRAASAWEQREMLDQWIARLAPQWPPKRQPGVDRSILRLAITEMTAGQTPPKVVIDEAVELAKAFSTEQSAGFVNAILDAVLKEQQELTSGGGKMTIDETRITNEARMTKSE